KVQNVTSAPGSTSTIPEKSGMSRSLFGATRGRSLTRSFGSWSARKPAGIVEAGLPSVPAVLEPHPTTADRATAATAPSEAELTAFLGERARCPTIFMIVLYIQPPSGPM